MLELVAVADSIPDIISTTDVPVETIPTEDITFEQIEPCPIDDHATYGIMIVVE